MFEVSASVWALTDDRAGHTAHTLGLAKGIGLEFAEKKLRTNRLACLPPPMFGSSLFHLTPQSRTLIRAPWPAIVIASGRRLVPVARYIKAQSPKTKLVQCLWPTMLEPFDVIVAPYHDDVPDDKRIIRYHGALHSLQNTALRDAAFTYASLFDGLPKPHYGVLIGGHSGRAKATIDDLHHLIDTAEFLVGDGSLIITTSRRTPKRFAEAIRNRLTCRYHLHEWHSSAANPYQAILALSDALIVSGDSISMISESCTTGKPVLIDTRFSSMRSKHHRAVQAFIAANYAYELRADLELNGLTPLILDEMARVSEQVKSHLSI